MPIHHRRIPVLPECPRVRPIAGHINRSYPVGRHNFSRACQGKTLTLTVTTEIPIPENIQANLLTTMNSEDGKTWSTVPFKRVDSRTLVCHIKPRYPGLHSFRGEYSFDKGNTWLRDTVPDAWVLVDPPQVDALRIYTLIPTVSGTIADWKADLRRIGEMGFNAIHLLPITAQDTSESPYSAKDLFDIDPSYLEKKPGQNGLMQLGEFVAEAKRLNIRLCFDLVLNHVGVNSNMSRKAPDWIAPDPKQRDGFQRARYWTNTGWCFWDDLILINYEHPSEAIRSQIWAYMIEYALFWAKYANDTGGFVRFDNLHSSDPDFVQALTKALHTEYPNVAILAEYFTDETTLLHSGPKWGLNLNLATPWDYKFVPQLREYLMYIHRVSKHVRYYMPATSHDSGAPAQEFGSAESIVPRYIAAALLGTGATGIIQGVEFGEMKKIEFIGRREKMQFPDEPVFGRFISQVNAILTQYPAFRHGSNCQFVDGGHPAIIAAFRSDTEMQDWGFLVVGNFDIYNSQRIDIDLTSVLGTEGPFSCCELLCGETQILQQPHLELLLQPSTAQVLRFLKNESK